MADLDLLCDVQAERLCHRGRRRLALLDGAREMLLQRLQRPAHLLLELGQPVVHFPVHCVERVEALIEGAGLPILPPRTLGADRFLELMAVDKKVLDGKLRLVLLKAIGRAYLADDFSRDALAGCLADYASGAA